MTVCIGIASRFDGLYFVTDTMVSDDGSSVEGVGKSFQITEDGQWVMMFAGNASTAAIIRKHVEKQLSSPCTEAHVVQACQSAYQTEIAERVNRNILFPYGTNLDQFRIEGPKHLGPDLYGQLVTKIHRASKLNLQLLILGFDHSFRPVERCIFEMTDRGERIDYSPVGYHAIGSGAGKAINVLDQKDLLNHVYKADELVYWLLAAKFAAHNVPTVGKQNTSVYGIDSSGMWSSMWAEDMERLRSLWHKETQRVPKRAISHIRKTFLIMPLFEARARDIARRRTRRK